MSKQKQKQQPIKQKQAPSKEAKPLKTKEKVTKEEEKSLVCENVVVSPKVNAMDGFILTLGDEDNVPELDRDDDDIQEKKADESENSFFDSGFTFDADSTFTMDSAPRRKRTRDSSGWDFGAAKDILRATKRQSSVTTTVDEKIQRKLAEKKQASEMNESDNDENVELNDFEFEEMDESDEKDESETDSDNEEEASEEEDENAMDKALMAQLNSDESDQEQDQVTNSFSLGKETNDSDSDSNISDEELEALRKDAYFEKPAANLLHDNEEETITFQSMNLSRPIVRGLTELGFQKPTRIQSKCIPVALMGKDICGGAVTGSGKTAAFVIPILERLMYRVRGEARSRVLILIPTRELAVQVHSVLMKIGAYADVSAALLVGGFSLKAQELELRARPDVLIATPGRLIDHLHNSPSFSLDTIEILVVDEADRILDTGFKDELEEIIRLCPRQRQTMLFSATMTDNIEELTRLSLDRPVRLFVDVKDKMAERLVQEFVRVRAGRDSDRDAILLALCKRVFKTKCIVFLPSKVLAHRTQIVFGLAGLRAKELHGNLTQLQRLEALEQFRDGEADFLLATDLAARGIDIAGIETVINYQMPSDYRQYLHRVGRTARAGTEGRAVTFVGEPDRKVLKQAMKNTNAAVKARALPPAVVARYRARLADMEPQIAEILREERDETMLRRAERDAEKAENLLEHKDEIYSRPARTWFQSTDQKKASKVAANAVNNERQGAAVKDKLAPSKNMKRTKMDGLSRRQKRLRLARDADQVAARKMQKVAARQAKAASRSKNSLPVENKKSKKSKKSMIKKMGKKHGNKRTKNLFSVRAEIIRLEKDTFHKRIAIGVWLVEFFSPRCHHCKAFAPHYDQLDKTVQAEQSRKEIFLSQIDCNSELNYDFCTAQGVIGYPTLKVYTDGVVTEEYVGPRLHDPLLVFLKPHIRLSPGQKAVLQQAQAPDSDIPVPPNKLKPLWGVDAAELDVHDALYVTAGLGDISESLHGAVIDLSGLSSIESRIQSGPWFIKFYAPWCGHCQKLAPVYASLATLLVGKVNVAHVDCTQSDAVCQREGVRGYPTLKYFDRGVPVEFHGDRTLDGLLEFCEEMGRPPVTHVANVTDFVEKIHHGKLSTTSFLYLYEKEVATRVLDENVVHSVRPFKLQVALYASYSKDFKSTPPFAKLLEKAPLPALLAMRDRETPRLFSGKLRDLDAVERFVKENQFGLVTEITPDNSAILLSADGENSAPFVLLASIPSPSTSVSFKTTLLPVLEKVARSLLLPDGSSSLPQCRVLYIDVTRYANYMTSYYSVSADEPSIVFVNFIEEIYANRDLDQKPFEFDAEKLNKALRHFLSNDLVTHSTRGVLGGWAIRAQRQLLHVKNSVLSNPWMTFIGVISIIVLFYIWNAVSVKPVRVGSHASKQE